MPCSDAVVTEDERSRIQNPDGRSCGGCRDLQIGLVLVLVGMKNDRVVVV